MRKLLLLLAMIIAVGASAVADEAPRLKRMAPKMRQIVRPDTAATVIDVDMVVAADSASLPPAYTPKTWRTNAAPSASAPRVYRPAIPAAAYMPTVFDRYFLLDTLSVGSADHRLDMMLSEPAQWLERELFMSRLLTDVKQRHAITHPELTPYNVATLPKAPDRPDVSIDPRQHKFRIERLTSRDRFDDIPMPIDIDRRNWFNKFEASLQFSQSYLSANWYQGGEGNLNTIGKVVWSNRLNRAFHPNLMFETSVEYKLALNNAPDDSLHRYNISEDIFKVLSKFGFKAWDKWFYSVTLQFKTQFLNNYAKNSNNLMAAFLSPAELNVGVGMTYNYASANSRVTFDASLSPVAWNMKTCTNSRIDPASVGIKDGLKVVNQLGVNVECKFKWQLCDNICYTTRLFAFSDYHYVQGDWENTIKFDINRFLSTQVFVHLRYDSSAPPKVASSWHYWQMKEILSLGFSYTFDNGI